MLKDRLNAALLALTIAGSVACFLLGHPVEGGALLAFAGGHLLQSPLKPKDDDDSLP